MTDASLDESHWSYWDRLADRFIARGPLLASDRTLWLGSVHIVDPPDDWDLRNFLADEPYQRAGLYSEHRCWHYQDFLGRTMWDYSRNRDLPCVFLLATDVVAPLSPESLATIGLPPQGPIVHGRITPIDSTHSTGLVLAYESLRSDVDAPLALPELQERSSVVLYDWEFGG